MTIGDDMPTADGPRRAGTRAAAAAPSHHDGHRRGRATIQARLRAAPRSAWRSGTPRRPLSRRGRRAERPQRADVRTCVILVDFRRAATRVGRWVRGDGLAEEASYVVDNSL